MRMIAHEMRYRQLKAMDKTIRMCHNDECYMESWLMIGIPDGSTDADFIDYADDPADFNEFFETFCRLVQRMDADPNEKSKTEIVEMFIANL